MNLFNTDVGINTTDTCTNLISYKPVGNLINHDWYEFITTKSRRPDLTTISTFSEVVYWYRPKAGDVNNPDSTLVSKFTGDAWQTSYAHFSKKFGFSHETIRRSLVKLEKLGAIRREFRSVKIKGQVFNNILFIHLGENINKFLTSTPSSKPVFLSSSHESPSPQIVGDHISNKISRNKSRSSESNFVKSNLEEKKLEVTSQSNLQNSCGIPEVLPEQKIRNQASVENTCALPDSETETILKQLSLVDRIKSKVLGNKKKPIAEFYPVSEEEARNLSISSGRDFNLNYINKLVERLGGKYPEHGFYTRKLFMKYLSLVLANELRQELVVNNETFRFRADSETDRREKYLSCVEDSISNDTISQLRRKIVAAFNQSTAYMLLTTCTFKGMTEDHTFEIGVNQNLELSEHQDRLLLDQIKSVYGNHTQGIEFTINAKYDHTKSSNPELPLNLGEEGSLWNRVSTKLLNYYGEGLHRSWFSKLEAVEDKAHTDNASNSIKKNSNEVILKAPTKFFRDYIISNYRAAIERFCNEEGINYGEIYS